MSRGLSGAMAGLVFILALCPPAAPGQIPSLPSVPGLPTLPSVPSIPGGGIPGAGGGGAGIPALPPQVAGVAPGLAGGVPTTPQSALALAQQGAGQVGGGAANAAAGPLNAVTITNRCCSIFDFLGVPQILKALRRLFQTQLARFLGSTFLGPLSNALGLGPTLSSDRFREIANAPPGTLPGQEPFGGPDIGGLPGPPNGLQVAAAIDAEKQKKKFKIQAIRFLAKEDCLCHPEIIPALLLFLDECDEDIRYEALLALRRQCGKLTCRDRDPCAKCNTYDPCECPRCHCTRDVIERLSNLLLDKNLAGFPKETSERNRRLAKAMILDCITCMPVLAPPPPPPDPANPDPEIRPQPDPQVAPLPPLVKRDRNQTGTDKTAVQLASLSEKEQQALASAELTPVPNDGPMPIEVVKTPAEIAAEEQAAAQRNQIPVLPGASLGLSTTVALPQTVQPPPARSNYGFLTALLGPRPAPQEEPVEQGTIQEDGTMQPRPVPGQANTGEPDAEVADANAGNGTGARSRRSRPEGPATEYINIPQDQQARQTQPQEPEKPKETFANWLRKRWQGHHPPSAPRRGHGPVGPDGWPQEAAIVAVDPHAVLMPDGTNLVTEGIPMPPPVTAQPYEIGPDGTLILQAIPAEPMPEMVLYEYGQMVPYGAASPDGVVMMPGMAGEPGLMIGPDGMPLPADVMSGPMPGMVGPDGMVYEGMPYDSGMMPTYESGLPYYTGPGAPLGPNAIRLRATPPSSGELPGVPPGFTGPFDAAPGMAIAPAGPTTPSATAASAGAGQAGRGTAATAAAKPDHAEMGKQPFSRIRFRRTSDTTPATGMSLFKMFHGEKPKPEPHQAPPTP